MEENKEPISTGDGLLTEIEAAIGEAEAVRVVPSTETVVSKEEYEKLGVYINAPVTKKERLFYGMGAFFDGGGASIAAVVMLVFFNKVLGISAIFSGIMVLLAKGWDAISDPLMGVISDNTRTKWGRRRPYFFLGGVLLFPSLAFLFAPIVEWPMALKFVSVTIAYIFYCTVSTISQVPYMSFSSEISSDYRERNKANTVKLVFSMIGAGICYLVPSKALEWALDGVFPLWGFWLVMTLGFGIFFGLPLILAAFNTKEKTPFNPTVKAKFSFKAYGIPLKVRSFRYHLGMYICAFMCMDIISALVIYYVMDCLNGMKLFGMEMSSMFVIAPMMVMAALMLPLVYFMMRKKTKQFAFRAGLPFYIAGGLVLAFLPNQQSIAWMVPVFAIIMGIGFAGAQMMPWIIFPDTIDVAELKLGYRPAGEFSGLMTFARKIASAVAVQISAVVIGIFEDESLNGLIPYVPQGEAFQWAVRIIMASAVLILILLAMFFSFKYKVTNAKLDRIKIILEKQRAHIDLSEEEQKEKEFLIKELA